MTEPTSEGAIVEAPSAPLPLDPFTTDIRPFVNFGPDGRIRHGGFQAVGYTWRDMKEGAYVAEGEARYSDAMNDFLDYAAWEDGAWIVAPRPELPHAFDTLELATRVAAVMPDLPPAKVTFTGPKSGEQPHPEQGPLEIGWTIPGTYVVRIEAFPHLPKTFEFTVRRPT